MSTLDHVIMAGPVIALIVALILGIVLGASGVAAWTAGRTAGLRRRMQTHRAAADADRAQVAELTALLGWLIGQTAQHAPREVWDRMLHRLRARGVADTDPVMRQVHEQTAPVPPDLERDLLAPADVRTSGRHARVGVDPDGA